MTVSRYHPLLVVLHWLLALMIIGMLIAGFLVLDPMQNSNPAQSSFLQLWR